MSDFNEVIKAWREDDAVNRIHPTREHQGEEAYWASGEAQAKQILWLVPKKAHVIDFGAGDGRLAIPLHNAGLKVLAVDSSKEMLQRITDREPEIATMFSNGNDLPKKYGEDSEKADALISRAVLIHHSYKDVGRLLKKFAEVVKPGGLLIVDLPISDRPAERSDWIGVTTWERSILLETTKMAGWEPIDADSSPSTWKRVDDSDVL